MPYDPTRPVQRGRDRGWGDPLPRTGHPLGLLAQAWIALNCFLGGGLLGGVIGMYGSEAAAKRVLGGPLPLDAEVLLTILGVAIGSVAGLFIANWLLRRLSERGAHLAVLTMTLIPVVGVYIAIALGLAGLWMRLGRPRT